MSNSEKPFEVVWERPCGLSIRQRRKTMAEARSLAKVKAETLPVGSTIRIFENGKQRFEQTIKRVKGTAYARKSAKV